MSDVGKILEGIHYRDAIHVAIAPVVAGVTLHPGQHVGMKFDVAVPAAPGKELGIVDPYLRDAVRPGEQFWLFLYPNTIQSLRHHWEHPAFRAAEVAKLRDEIKLMAAQDWMEDLAREVRMAPDELMDQLREVVQNTGHDYIHLGFDTPDMAGNTERIWECYELITGEKIEEGRKKLTIFFCAC